MSNCIQFETFESAIYDKHLPVLVSFFAGAPHYKEKARDLIATCKSLRINFEIMTINDQSDTPWPKICLFKIMFYKQLAKTYKNGFFWVDIDVTIKRVPEFLKSKPQADLSCFLRSFSNLDSFDRAKYSRAIHPGYLLFGNTEKTYEFIDFLYNKAISHESEEITDDFILQEGIAAFSNKLSILIFPSEIVASNSNDQNDRAVFVHGDSGNVNRYKKLVKQHDKIDPKIRISVINQQIDYFLNKQQYKEALVFSERALELDSDNPNAYHRVLKVLRRLKDYKGLDKYISLGKSNLTLQLNAFLFDYERHAKFGSFEQANKVLEEARKSGNQEVISLLESRGLRFSLDEKASKLGISNEESSFMVVGTTVPW